MADEKCDFKTNLQLYSKTTVLLPGLLMQCNDTVDRSIDCFSVLCQQLLCINHMTS